MTHHLCNLDWIAGTAEEQELNRFGGAVEQQVHQTAHNADATGQDQVERFFAEPKFLTNTERPLPMTPEELAPLSEERCDRQKRHNGRLAQRDYFARTERTGRRNLDAPGVLNISKTVKL